MGQLYCTLLPADTQKRKQNILKKEVLSSANHDFLISPSVARFIAQLLLLCRDGTDYRKQWQDSRWPRFELLGGPILTSVFEDREVEGLSQVQLSFTKGSCSLLIQWILLTWESLDCRTGAAKADSAEVGFLFFAVFTVKSHSLEIVGFSYSICLEKWNLVTDKTTICVLLGQQWPVPGNFCFLITELVKSKLFTSSSLLKSQRGYLLTEM